MARGVTLVSLGLEGGGRGEKGTGLKPRAQRDKPAEAGSQCRIQEQV